MSRLVQQPHEGYVMLMKGCLGDIIFHHITGEIYNLPQRGVLCFDDEGFGFIEYDDASESEWVDHVFKWFLFKDMRGDFYFKGPSDTISPRDEWLFKGIVSKVFSWRNVNAKLFFEVIHFSIPRCGARVRWCVPHIMNHIFGDTYTCDWFHNKKAPFIKMIERCQMDPNGIAANTQLDIDKPEHT
jgi:hypothetical protein